MVINVSVLDKTKWMILSYLKVKVKTQVETEFVNCFVCLLILVRCRLCLLLFVNGIIFYSMQGTILLSLLKHTLIVKHSTCGIWSIVITSLCFYNMEISIIKCSYSVLSCRNPVNPLSSTVIGVSSLCSRINTLQRKEMYIWLLLYRKTLCCICDITYAHSIDIQYV